MVFFYGLNGVLSNATYTYKILKKEYEASIE